MEKTQLPGRPSHRRALGVAIALLTGAASIVGSYSAGAPRPDPGIALGWGLLFHLERASLLVGVIALFALVSWRALQGELPIKFGQILEYAPPEALSLFDRLQNSLDARIASLEDELRSTIESEIPADKRLH
jgi:hypothetical protein